MLNRVSKAAQRRLTPSPVAARHMEYSMVYSEDDSVSQPSQGLLDLSIKAIALARETFLDDVGSRLGGRFPYPDDLVNVWPGEHYRLLAALVQILKPQLVVEIGTAEGLSALSMLKYLPMTSRMVSFDLVPWSQYPRPCLSDADFRDGRLIQIIGDLGDPEVFNRHADLLSKADLVFIDAAKDGVLERRLIASFEKLPYESEPLFVLDDIRLWNMLSTWRDLRWPKLDLTSFGHWCGTGICAPVLA
jgi:hypothetical protein